MTISVGFFPYSTKRGPFEPTKGRPVRLYNKRSTAEKVVADWGRFDPLVYGEVSAVEAFAFVDPDTSGWKRACNALADAAAQDRQSLLNAAQLLATARQYVSESLEAHEHEDGRSLLFAIDAFLSREAA